MLSMLQEWRSGQQRFANQVWCFKLEQLEGLRTILVAGEFNNVVLEEIRSTKIDSPISVSDIEHVVGQSIQEVDAQLISGVDAIQSTFLENLNGLATSDDLAQLTDQIAKLRRQIDQLHWARENRLLPSSSPTSESYLGNSGYKNCLET